MHKRCIGTLLTNKIEILLQCEGSEQLLNHYNLVKLPPQSVTSPVGIPWSHYLELGIQGRLFRHRLILTESSRTDILSAINVKKWLEDIGYAVVPLAFRIIQISELNITV